MRACVIMIATMEAGLMEALKLKIALGIKDLDHGRFQTYNDASLMQLADEIGQCGREFADFKSK